MSLVGDFTYFSHVLAAMLKLFSLTLGYYARGTQVTLVAICRPQPASPNPQIVDIVTTNLNTKANRIKHVIRIINLCSLIKPLAEAVGPREVVEFRPIQGSVQRSYAHIDNITFYLTTEITKQSKCAGPISGKRTTAPTALRKSNDSPKFMTYSSQKACPMSIILHHGN
jgi:hypothetical protein